MVPPKRPQHHARAWASVAAPKARGFPPGSLHRGRPAPYPSLLSESHRGRPIRGSAGPDLCLGLRAQLFRLSGTRRREMVRRFREEVAGIDRQVQLIFPSLATGRKNSERCRAAALRISRRDGLWRLVLPRRSAEEPSRSGARGAGPVASAAGHPSAGRAHGVPKWRNKTRRRRCQRGHRPDADTRHGSAGRGFATAAARGHCLGEPERSGAAAQRHQYPSRRGASRAGDRDGRQCGDVEDGRGRR